MRLIWETFRPWILAAVLMAQAGLMLAGFFFALLALFAHLGMAALYSLLFFAVAVLLTLAKRWLTCPSLPGKRFRLIAAALGLTWLGTAIILQAAHLHLNTSDSVPVGLYRETVAGSAKYAGVCLSSEQLQTARNAGLELDRGECAGGVSPILKPLIQASPDQPITFTQQGFVIDGQLLPNTKPKPESRTHVPLTHTPFGTYTSGLWAISSYNPDSYDSRYFGPLEESAVRFHATPFLTQ